MGFGARGTVLLAPFMIICPTRTVPLVPPAPLKKSISQKIPAYELNELIFSYPYVKIKLLEEKKIAKRQAASTYLQELANRSILSSFKVGREVYYVNDGLMGILSNK